MEIRLKTLTQEKRTSNPEGRRSIHSFRRAKIGGGGRGFCARIDGRGEDRLLLFFRRFSPFSFSLLSSSPSSSSLNPSRQPPSLLSHATPVVRRLEESGSKVSSLGYEYGESIYLAIPFQSFVFTTVVGLWIFQLPTSSFSSCPSREQKCT